MKRFAPPTLVAIAVLFSGCVSSKYKLAKPAEMRPPLVVNLAAAQPPLEAMLNTVIVYRGPGSWKREAYWDEYVLTIANRGRAPLTINSVSLTGLATTPAAPGLEPWSVEKQSRTLENQGFGLAQDTAVQIGGGVATIAVSAAAGAGAFTLIYGAGWGAGAAGAAILGTVALPVFIGGSIYANVSSRHEVEREFARRHLQLPATLVVGQIAQGSLYFPITPGPQRLTFHCRIDGEPRNVSIDLTPLSGLHLKSAPAQAKSVHAAEAR